MLDGDPWFVAADVCRALGYATKKDGTVNTYLATLVVGSDEKATYRVSSLRGPQKTTIISESGLYKLVMRSDKPLARQFQDWVTREVLPSIRKDGAYFAGQDKLASGEMDEAEFLARALVAAQDRAAQPEVD